MASLTDEKSLREARELGRRVGGKTPRELFEVYAAGHQRAVEAGRHSHDFEARWAAEYSRGWLEANEARSERVKP